MPLHLKANQGLANQNQLYLSWDMYHIGVKVFIKIFTLQRTITTCFCGMFTANVWNIIYINGGGRGICFLVLNNLGFYLLFQINYW